MLRDCAELAQDALSLPLLFSRKRRRLRRSEVYASRFGTQAAAAIVAAASDVAANLPRLTPTALLAFNISRFNTS